MAEILEAFAEVEEVRSPDELVRVEVSKPAGKLESALGPHAAEETWPLVWGEALGQSDGQPASRVRVALSEREGIRRDLLLLGIFGVLGLTLGLALYFFPLRLFREEDLVRLFARRSIKAAEDERLRLSRDLHDGLGQALGAAAISLARLAAKDGPGAEPSPEAKESIRLIDGALDELRRVTQGLRIPTLDDLGMGAAVESLAREAARTGLCTEVRIQELPRLDPDLEETCFRLAQEGLANVVRHAHARTVKVTLSEHAGQVVLEIRDDGRGFAQGAGWGLGLTGARERAARISGSLNVESAPGQGTRLRAVLPV